MALVGAAAISKYDDPLNLFGVPTTYKALIPLALIFDGLGILGRFKSWSFVPPIDHVAHMGGLFFGVVYTLLILRRARKKQNELRMLGESLETDADYVVGFEELQEQAERESLKANLKPNYRNPYIEKGSHLTPFSNLNASTLQKLQESPNLAPPVPTRRTSVPLPSIESPSASENLQRLYFENMMDKSQSKNANHRLGRLYTQFKFRVEHQTISAMADRSPDQLKQTHTSQEPENF